MSTYATIRSTGRSLVVTVYSNEAWKVQSKTFPIDKTKSWLAGGQTALQKAIGFANQYTERVAML